MAPEPAFSCILDGVQFVHINAIVTQPVSQTSLRESVESGISKEPQLVSLRFHYTRRMADVLREDAEKARREQEELERQKAEEEEAHRRKYAIVEKIKGEMTIKENTAQMSLVDKYAYEAQQEFMQVSMKELRESGNFSCPPKYLNQRDTALEIPIECVRKLCDAVDTDFDDKVSEQELREYIKKHDLPFEEDVPSRLFNEAIQGRGYVNEK